MIWIGTSGFQYPEWKGVFYPQDLPTARMLSFYSAEFATTEINYTFYRFPAIQTLENWATQTPPRFCFSLKAPRKITHEKKLVDCAEYVSRFCHTVEVLGVKLGALLFQFPPTFQINLQLFAAFLETLPRGLRTAFEFRHASWQTEEVYQLLRQHGRALCVADSEDRKTPRTLTADFGYFRLRDEGYEKADVVEWARTIAGYARDLRDVYVYFKHEEKGLGPQFARWFKEGADAAGAGVASSEQG